ncbi:MAG: hypothetical protein JSS86_09865 [Cyanobacteria bacterium SZAS LIN-2]|nr:hypothetical protein [Cyanobacteria bacterium SZAS LIN-3]MBS1996607.1 hypothetical protein [Cyanobacteria bacterium SZAS LIN-2]
MKTRTTTNISTKIALATLMIISLSPVCATSAIAGMTDAKIVDQLQDAKSRLLRKEYQLLRDQDDLKRQLDDLKRRNDGNVLAGTIDDVARRLDKTYADLRQTRIAISDVSRSLL